MLLALFSPAFAGLLINEVVYRTAGDDAEWVEICNSGPDAVDLTGYVLQGATGTTWSQVYDADLSGTVAVGDYLLIGSGAPVFSAAFSPALGNVSSDTDGIRLVDGTGIVVDTLLYGSPNTDGLVDDA